MMITSNLFLLVSAAGEGATGLTHCSTHFDTTTIPFRTNSSVVRRRQVNKWIRNELRANTRRGICEEKSDLFGNRVGSDADRLREAAGANRVALGCLNHSRAGCRLCANPRPALERNKIMPEFVDWSTVRDAGELYSRVGVVLDRGEWVAFPTETGTALAACVDRAEALTRIPAEGWSWSLGMPEAANLAEWAGELSPLARRLIRRTWPGPVCFEFSQASPTESAAQLHELTRMRLTPEGGLAMRRPAHDAILDVLAQRGRPLVLAEPTPENANWLATAGDAVGLVLEDGPPRYNQPATRVRIDGNSWRITSPGAFSEDDLRPLTSCLVLFICTGNTCRSPMAEVIFKKILADRLGCGIDELPARGWWVTSAGLLAWAGEPAAAEAQKAVAEFGGDLSGHRSRPLRADLASEADYLITMTGEHLTSLRGGFSELGSEPRRLAGDEDLADPVGGNQAVYDECARTIRTHLERLAAEVMS
jgi:protein arginine phosphatase